MSRSREMLATARRLKRAFGPWRATTMICRKWLGKVRHSRPPNTVQANVEVWSTHDWSSLGEEWTPSAEWRQAVVDELIAPYVRPGVRVLEIGPGGGRWTRELLRNASRVTLVDLSPVCIGICRERFGVSPPIDYHVNDGTDLGFLADGSIDVIWSFDCFVHIEPGDIARYVGQFPRVLAPEGLAVIHHSRKGVYRRSWRSNMSEDRMADLCRANGLKVVTQVHTLRNGSLSVYPEGGIEHPDCVTVIHRG